MLSPSLHGLTILTTQNSQTSSPSSLISAPSRMYEAFWTAPDRTRRCLPASTHSPCFRQSWYIYTSLFIPYLHPIPISVHTNPTLTSHACGRHHSTPSDKLLSERLSLIAHSLRPQTLYPRLMQAVTFSLSDLSFPPSGNGWFLLLSLSFFSS